MTALTPLITLNMSVPPHSLSLPITWVAILTSHHFEHGWRPTPPPITLKMADAPHPFHHFEHGWQSDSPHTLLITFNMADDPRPPSFWTWLTPLTPSHITLKMAAWRPSPLPSTLNMSDNWPSPPSSHHLEHVAFTHQPLYWTWTWQLYCFVKLDFYFVEVTLIVRMIFNFQKARDSSLATQFEKNPTRTMGLKNSIHPGSPVVSGNPQKFFKICCSREAQDPSDPPPMHALALTQWLLHLFDYLSVVRERPTKS